MQHYVIKFVSDLRQVGRFLHVLSFPPPLKLKVALNTINQTKPEVFLILTRQSAQ
jgi:hypothetical protein